MLGSEVSRLFGGLDCVAEKKCNWADLREGQIDGKNRNPLLHGFAGHQ